MPCTRRQTLQALVAAGVGALLPGWTRAAAWQSPADPFRLGVASGYPTGSSVVIWTLLAPEPLAPDRGMPPVDVELRWEVAADESFQRIVARGFTRAEAAFAHSARVEVKGLGAARDYWYRFTAGGQRSPVGRTRTLPARGAHSTLLKITVANCQHYEHGHFAAYRHIADSAPDLLLHLGDYIYEGAPVVGRVRPHMGSLCRTLADYRLRYAQYQLDAALQAAHAAAPWMLTWDDHEVANDYSGLHSGRNEDPAEFLLRRTAAYRAYYEHLPLPPSSAPRGTGLPLFARRHLGDLATIHLIDQRQYRSPQACAQPNRAGGNRSDENCTDLQLPERTMLGAAQESWLDAGLAGARTRWNLLAQGTMMSRLDERSGPGEVFGTDGWNGYPAARGRLLDSLQRHNTSNPVVLSGDLHAFMVASLRVSPGDTESKVIAPEFVATSITSDPRPQAQLDGWRAENPGIQVAEGRYRGYLALELTPHQLTAKQMILDDVRSADSGQKLLQSFTVEAGSSLISPT